jgi:hypothetical protein
MFQKKQKASARAALSIRGLFVRALIKIIPESKVAVRMLLS